MTRPSSDPYCKRSRLPSRSHSGKRTSTSPPTNGLRTSSEEQSPHYRYHDATRTNNLQALGEEASRRSPHRRTTRLSCPRGTPRRRTDIGRHPQRPMYVPQGHAPHPPELQRLQALRRERPTLPTSATSPTMRRTRRTSTTPAAGRGRRRSIPARRRRSQRHLRRTRVAREQEAAEAQRPSDTDGGHQPSRPVSMVRTPDHLHSDGSMDQLRSFDQIPAPRRSGDPREQGKEGVSGQGKQHQRHLPSDTPRLGSRTQRAPRVRHSFLRHCAN
jgi:hypothetical protein